MKSSPGKIGKVCQGKIFRIETTRLANMPCNIIFQNDLTMVISLGWSLANFNESLVFSIQIKN